MAALAGPLVHAALDIGSSADFEKHSLWLLAVGIGECGHNVAGSSAAGAAASGRRSEEVPCGVDGGRLSSRFRGEPEHVDVAGFVGIGGRLRYLLHEHRRRVGIEGVWDERLEVARRGGGGAGGTGVMRGLGP